MRHDTDGNRNSVVGCQEGSIRIQRMGRAVDEIVEAFALLADADAAYDSHQRRKLAAASRRLWVLASRRVIPGNLE